MADQRISGLKLGRLNHIGIVVKDMEQAMEYYSSVFGLGPFTTQVVELKGFLYRGRPADARVMAALAFTGQVFVELVQVLEGETAHTEFLREKGEGVQHVAFLVRDLDGALAELAKKGIEPIMRYSVPVAALSNLAAADGGAPKKQQMEVHEAYLESDRIGGTVIQLMQFKKLPSA